MSTNHSPAASDAVKETDAPAPAQEAATADTVSAATVNNDAAAKSASAEASTAPAVPPGPDLDPDLEHMLLGFYADSTNYPELNNGAADLPRGVSAMLASLSEWAHRLAGSGVELQSLEGRPREILKATAFFVQRALLAPRGSHYRVLGLNATASASEIHDHYRYLRRLFSVTDPDGTAHAAVMRVSEAYVVLRDPARRRAYDASVFGSGALPRLEAERRGTTGGKQGSVGGAEHGRARRWISMGAAFAVVLGIFWGLGGFDEPAIEVDAPTASAPETDAAAPEIASPAAENTPALTGDSTSSETPPQTATTDTAPAPLAESSTATRVEPSDKALLDRVEKFAGDETPEDAAATTPAVTATPNQQAESPPDTAVAQSESPPTPEHTAPAETGATSDATATDDAVSQAPAEPEDTPTPSAEAPPTAAAAGPEVAVIPVLPEPTPDAPAAPQSEAQVEQLLARAERQVRDGQLTTPEGNSAADSYQKVLRLDPNNARAAQGMTAIADRYAMLARYRLRRDELAEARTMVERGLEIAPTHGSLLAAKSDIEARSAALTAPRTSLPTPSRDDSSAATSAGAIAPLASGSSPPLSPGASTATVQQPSRPSPGTPMQPGPIASTPAQPAPITSRPAQSTPTESEALAATAATPSVGAASIPAATAPSSAAAAAPTAAGPLLAEKTSDEDSTSAQTTAGSTAAARQPEPQPEQPAATVASAAPPPTASTAPAPGATNAQGPFSEQALNDLAAKFVQFYEGGDLESFMALFTPDAETNSRKGSKGIRQDYTSLFAGSQSRLMRLKDLRWNRSGDEAVGEADFSLSLFGRRESRPNAYEGRLTFRVVERNGAPVIKGLFHSQRKLDDG